MKKPRWLLLTHQLPNEPSNLRVKVWRKLQSLGAVPIKNSVYVLPNGTAAREDFDWLRREIAQSGGEASVFAADSVAEKDDVEIIRSFRGAREKDHAAFAEAVGAFNEQLATALSGGHIKGDALEKLERQWAAHKTEWERLTRIDFFRAPRADADKAVKRGQALLGRARTLSVRVSPAPPPAMTPKELKGVVWVTRASPHVDRLACAWLVRRFVDPKARFKFVDPAYGARPKEVRFDMDEGEFTHFGDWCSFETIMRRLRIADPVVTTLAEIIHDIDLKDRKFSRPEASGVALAVRGLCRTHAADGPRLEAGLVFFDGLYAALAAEAKR